MPLLAVTVDFFRKGAYTPALAATAPVFNPDCHSLPFASKTVVAPDAERPLSPERGRDGSPKNETRLGGDAANNLHTNPDCTPDTEPEICMFWLQVIGQDNTD